MADRVSSVHGETSEGQFAPVAQAISKVLLRRAQLVADGFFLGRDGWFRCMDVVEEAVQRRNDTRVQVTSKMSVIKSSTASLILSSDPWNSIRCCGDIHTATACSRPVLQ
jgi:hypothetical protein